MINLIKLVTGEEVLARYEIVGDVFYLENPVRLQLSQKGVAMIPLSPFMKENSKIAIKSQDVIYTVEPDEDVVNAYNQQFGGIVIASSGLTLG